MTDYAFVSYHAIRALSCLFLGIATILSLVGFAFSKDKSIELRGHWGGFGSGTRGWKVSRPLSFLVASMVFALFLALVAISAPVRQSGEDLSRNEPAAAGGANTQPADSIAQKELPNKDAAKASQPSKK